MCASKNNVVYKTALQICLCEDSLWYIFASKGQKQSRTCDTFFPAQTGKRTPYRRNQRHWSQVNKQADKLFR